MHEQWEPTGGVEVKGKGRMQTYLWLPPATEPAHPVAPSAAASTEFLPCLPLMQAHAKLLGLSAPRPAIRHAHLLGQPFSPGSEPGAEC